MARGGPRLPPRNAVRGGSLRRLPFPLAPRLGHEPRACRPPALGGGNLRNQSAHQRWDPDVTFLSANARHPMLGAVRQWRAWARGRRGGRARLDRMRPGSWMALLRPRAGDAVTGTPGPARHSFHSATHLHLAVGPVGVTERAGGRGRPGQPGPAGRTTLVERVWALPGPVRSPDGRRPGGAGGPAGGRAPAVATVLPRPARPAVADGRRAPARRAARARGRRDARACRGCRGGRARPDRPAAPCRRTGGAAVRRHRLAGRGQPRTAAAAGPRPPHRPDRHPPRQPPDRPQGAVRPGRTETPMALAKLKLTVEHTGEEILLPFNPEEFTLNHDNTFASQAIPGLSGPILQFVNGNMQTLDMELFFDTWDTDSAAKKDVRELTNRVVRLLEIDRDLHAPPVLRVQWGSLDFLCVLAKANQKFQMFADNGRPVRARVSVTFNRFIDAEREAKEVPRQTSDFTKVHVVVQGETLSGIAAHHYEDARQWRPIALASELDDPRAITPGQAMRVPSLPFNDPETGEAVR